MRHIALAAALAFAGSAQAAVVYNWQTVDTEFAGTVTGQLVLTDAAYRSGRVDYVTARSGEGDQPDDYSDPNSPVISILFGLDADEGGDTPHFDLNYVTGEGFGYYYPGEFAFDAGATLANGRLRAANMNEGAIFDSGGPGDLFLVDSYIDYFYCTGAPTLQGTCQPVSGRWVLDESTVPAQASVPLPGTFALLGLGFAALGYSRRVREHPSTI